ncbi:MAG: carbohydrate kinase family protein [Planctomycetota bacterium]|jgi:fructokinase
MSPVIIGVGEMLWDLFPDGRRPGGSPFNFAWHVRMLGADGQVITRLGGDEPGDELAALAAGAGMDPELIQRDGRRPTGTVRVELDEGQPTFTITEDVAWDFLEASGPALSAAASADAVCFGTLSRRSPAARRAIAQLLEAAAGARLIFDVNLRQRYYTRELLESSLRAAHVAKLNSEELSAVAAMVRPGGCGAQDLVEAYALDLLVETRGAAGCVLHRAGGSAPFPGVPVEVADAVGAGDAFTAALAVGLCAGRDLEEAGRRANLVGAYVASRSGAAPSYTPADLAEFAASADVRL